MDVPGRHNGQPDRERMAGGEIGNVVGGGRNVAGGRKETGQGLLTINIYLGLAIQIPITARTLLYGQLMRI